MKIGLWVGNGRIAEILRQYGLEWSIVSIPPATQGVSEPLGVAKTAQLALQRGIRKSTCG